MIDYISDENDINIESFPNISLINELMLNTKSEDMKRVCKTFSEIVLTERMKKAMILIRRSDMSIEKIASLVGYGDTSNFYKAFQRVYHMTPREAARTDP